MFSNQDNDSKTLVITETAHSQTAQNILSDSIRSICQWILLTFLCQAIVLFGVGGNIVNIICFVKMGFKEPINITLLGLAVSDLGSLCTLIWTNICCTPAFMTADMPFDPIELQYLTAGVPHTVFTRITGWITAFITLERCLCITLPLKVKSIITSTRVFVITISVFLILISGSAPEYVANRIGDRYFPHRNKTLIGLVHVAESETIMKLSYLINNVCVPFTSFTVIIVCTSILVAKLRSQTKWRKESTVHEQADSNFIRNQKAAKMVVMISFLFIVCFIPVSILFMAMSLEPELLLGGAYINVSMVLGAFGITLESINSSLNIFFYYSMSRNYRSIFQQTVCASRAEQFQVKVSLNLQRRSKKLQSVSV